MKKISAILPLIILGLSLKAQSPPTFPLIDYHVHLKGDLTYEKAVEQSKRTGIIYGVALNCGLGFPTQTDSAALAWLSSMKGSPFLLAMQAEGRQWVKLFSPAVIAKFDYVFTDAMTYTDASGKRVRLWIKEEVSVPEKQLFMDDLVGRIVTILGTEPIHIYVNPTFLPDVIAAGYDKLWTRERMMKVINAAVQNHVAIEINNRYRLPSEKFIKLAKKKGVKFAFGTNNTDSHMGDLDWCLKMKRKCRLEAINMFQTGTDK
ncbi:MAG: hypothetical protein WC699_11375 [Bacteroidales bacterium]|jgi:hypothetical protein